MCEQHQAPFPQHARQRDTRDGLNMVSQVQSSTHDRFRPEIPELHWVHMPEQADDRSHESSIILISRAVLQRQIEPNS